MTFRIASLSDVAVLAALNEQLIEDERHRNRRTVAELQERMAGWLAGEYGATLFFEGSEVIGYALFRENAEEVYLRQLFISRSHRRKGYGKEAIRLLRTEVWPRDKRLTVDVLVTNHAAIEFWRAVGFQDYCITLEILPLASGHAGVKENAQG